MTGVLFATCLTAVCAISQSRPTPPDLSGKWTVVSDVVGSNSPLGREGTITQDESTITFRSSTQALAIALDGSKQPIRADRLSQNIKRGGLVTHWSFQ